MDFHADHIRNVAVLGHQSAGKTTLVESLVAITEDKAGTNDAKSTRGGDSASTSSKSLSVVPVFYRDYKINLIDIPGNDDFIFEALGVTRLIKGAILVIDASKGVEVETIKHFNILKKKNIPTFIYLNKMDKEEAKFAEVVEEIKQKIGKKSLTFTYPIGKNEHFDGFINVVDLKARKFNGSTCEDDIIYDDKKAIAMELHNAISETVALSDDTLLDKFFSGTELTADEIHSSLRKGVLAGEFDPIIVGSATNKIGLHTMLNMFIDYLPAPNDLKPYEGKDLQGNEIERKTDETEPFSAYVFKTTYNSYTGIVNIIKVNSGTISVGDEIYCPDTDETQKVTSLFFLNGTKQVPTTKAYAGDIVALAKLKDIYTSYTLCDKNNPIVFEKVKYPTAVFFKAITTKNKTDEEKLGSVLDKIKLEDSVIEIKRNYETKQLLLGGTSETHVAYTIEKIKSQFGIALDTSTPRVVYRETIKGSQTIEGRYIKQSGGSGFYGVVVMRFEKNQDGDENVFEEAVVGGTVPKGYFPAVEKGFNEAVKQGLLAGFPVIGMKATLLDGKYHPVDSNEQAFKMAAIRAYKDAYMKCDPTILEPIIVMKIHVPQDYVGNVMSDLTNRRAQILNMEDTGEASEITATAPEAEILDYASKLRTLTQGSGFYNIKFDSYREVPKMFIDGIIKQYHVETKDE